MLAEKKLEIRKYALISVIAWARLKSKPRPDPAPAEIRGGFSQEKVGGCWSSEASSIFPEQRQGSGGAAPSGVQGQRPGGGLGGGIPGFLLLR